MAELHELDQKIHIKRSQWSAPERLLKEIQYERRLGDDHGVYLIKTNDTLPEIAERFNVSVDDLVRWNNIENPKVIYFGSCLFVREPK